MSNIGAKRKEGSQILIDSKVNLTSCIDSSASKYIISLGHHLAINHSQISDNDLPHYEKAWYRSSHRCWTITDEHIIWGDSGQECIL